MWEKRCETMIVNEEKSLEIVLMAHHKRSFHFKRKYSAMLWEHCLLLHILQPRPACCMDRTMYVLYSRYSSFIWQCVYVRCLHLQTKVDSDDNNVDTAAGTHYYIVEFECLLCYFISRFCILRDLKLVFWNCLHSTFNNILRVFPVHACVAYCVIV